MNPESEREILITLLQRCLEKIFAEQQETKYFSELYRICFPWASCFVVGKNPRPTLRWLFRSATFEQHATAIALIAFPET